MKYNKLHDFYRIGNVKIHITNPTDCSKRIIDYIRAKRKGYVCVSNMRTVAVANSDSEYHKVMENSLLNTPDGTPLVWCGKMWGLKKVERACGPHIFQTLLSNSESSLRHFFLGDTDETLQKLINKCQKEYNTKVVGCYSPPFKPIEEYDLNGIAKMINESNATIVWTSLRAPKQDFLNSKLLPYLNDGVVLVGIGAAFRFYLGEYHAPEGFLQKIGLAGLGAIRNSTLLKELQWYAKHAAILGYYLISIAVKRILGKPYWE